MKNVNMTVRELARSLGLKRDGVDYIGATVLVKVLCRAGVAKKSGTVPNAGRGRKSVVYSIPTTITLKTKRRKKAAA